MQVGHVTFNVKELGTFLYHENDNLLQTLKTFGKRVIYSIPAMTWLNSNNVLKLLSNTQTESDLDIFNRVKLNPTVEAGLASIRKRFENDRIVHQRRLAQEKADRKNFLDKVGIQANDAQVADEPTFVSTLVSEVRITYISLQVLIDQFKRLNLSLEHVESDERYLFENIKEPFSESTIHSKMGWWNKNGYFIRSFKDAAHALSVKMQRAIDQNKPEIVQEVTTAIKALNLGELPFDQDFFQKLDEPKSTLYHYICKPSDDVYLAIKRDIPDYQKHLKELENEIKFRRTQRLKSILSFSRGGESLEQGINRVYGFSIKILAGVVARHKKLKLPINGLDKLELFFYQHISFSNDDLHNYPNVIPFAILFTEKHYGEDFDYCLNPYTLIKKLREDITPHSDSFAVEYWTHLKSLPNDRQVYDSHIIETLSSEEKKIANLLARTFDIRGDLSDITKLEIFDALYGVEQYPTRMREVYFKLNNSHFARQNLIKFNVPVPYDTPIVMSQRSFDQHKEKMNIYLSELVIVKKDNVFIITRTRKA